MKNFDRDKYDVYWKINGPGLGRLDFELLCNCRSKGVQLIPKTEHDELGPGWLDRCLAGYGGEQDQ